MNERIRELWERACTRYSVYETLKPQDERKNIPVIFAELIVRECSQLDFYITGEVTKDGDAVISNLIKKHFGVEQ